MLKQCEQGIIARRLIGVVTGSALFVALTMFLAANAGVAAGHIAEFGVLEFLLGVVSFRWWYQPLYTSTYNYCSPLAIVCSVAYIYAGPGNALSFGYDYAILSANIGAMDYIRWPAVSAVSGLIAFDLAYRATSRALGEKEMYPFFLHERVVSNRMRVSISAVLWVGATIGLHLYLASQYSLFSRGSIAGSDLDNVLFQSRFVLLMTAWAAASALIAGARTISARCVGCLLAIALLPDLMTFLSRQYAVRALVCTLFALLLMRRTTFVRVRTMIVLGTMGLLLFVVLTSVRSALMYGQLSVEQLEGGTIGAMLSNPTDLGASALYLRDYNQNRLSGLELPAAIERSHQTEGIPWMYGYHNWLVIARSVPRFIWRGKPQTDPEVAINRHFGLQDVDQLTVPFGSGYADGGILGVAVGLALMGVCLCGIQHLVWRLKSGALIYTGSTAILLNFEQYIAEYPLDWLRCLTVVLLLDAVIRLVTMPAAESPARDRKAPRKRLRWHRLAPTKPEPDCSQPEGVR